MAWLNRYFSSVQKQHPTQVEFMHLDDEEEFMEDKQEAEGQQESNIYSRAFICELLVMMVIPIPYVDGYLMFRDSPPDEINNY